MDRRDLYVCPLVATPRALERSSPGPPSGPRLQHTVRQVSPQVPREDGVAHSHSLLCSRDRGMVWKHLFCKSTTVVKYCAADWLPRASPLLPLAVLFSSDSAVRSDTFCSVR